MKGSTITSWWISICLCAAFLTEAPKAGAQSPELLAAAGDYRAAGYAYEKQAWQAQDNRELALALISRIGCLQMESRFEEAEHVASRIRYEGISDTLVVRGRSAAALTFYMAGKYGDAESELRQMAFLVPDQSLTRASLFLLALTLNEQRRWTEADSIVHLMISRSPASVVIRDSLMQLFQTSYDSTSYPRMKSPDLARKWSTFIPGAGHMYAGYIGEGLLNFTLQAASLGFIGYHIYIAHYLTAFTIGSGLFQHFYFGGIKRAGFLAEKRNYRNLRDFNDPIREQILSMQSLLYPS